MLEERYFPAADRLAEECDIVPFCFSFFLDAVQDTGKIFVCQAACGFIHENDSDIVGDVRLQQPGSGIRRIMHLFGNTPNQFNSLLADVCITVQRFGNCRRGDSAFLGYVFYSCHGFPF